MELVAGLFPHVQRVFVKEVGRDQYFPVVDEDAGLRMELGLDASQQQYQEDGETHGCQRRPYI